MEELRKKVCCIDLFNALEDGLLDERVSGIFLQPKTDGCCSHKPMIKCCPFCGAKIKTISLENSWDWGVEKKLLSSYKEPLNAKD